MQKKLLSSKCTNLQDIKTVGLRTFGQIQGHFDLTPIFLVASRENGLQNSSKSSITKLIEARITKGVTKTTRNKMPEGINVGCTGYHLQSLKFYMENNKFNSDSSKQRNEIASQQDRILCEVTHSNSNLSQQGLISVRSTSMWLCSITDHTSIPHNNYLQTSQTVTDYKQRNYLQFKLQLGNH